MSIGVLPNTIPVSGERYDMTLDRIGEHKKNLTARFIIDNGEFQGKKVSCGVDSALNDILANKLYEIDPAIDGTNDTKLASGLNTHSKKIRFSGKVIVIREAAPNGDMIRVDDEYRESNVKVTYHITEFREPVGESSLSTTFRGSF